MVRAMRTARSLVESDGRPFSIDAAIPADRHGKTGGRERRLMAERYESAVAAIRRRLDFLEGRINEFGTWHDNVSSWLAARESSDRFLLVRYEDLLKDGVAQMAGIAAMLGRHASPAARTRTSGRRRTAAAARSSRAG